MSIFLMKFLDRLPHVKERYWLLMLQGVEAQSVANSYSAIEEGLEIIPVVNKIDLPAADPDKVLNDIMKSSVLRLMILH